MVHLGPVAYRVDKLPSKLLFLVICINEGKTVESSDLTTTDILKFKYKSQKAIPEKVAVPYIDFDKFPGKMKNRNPSPETGVLGLKISSPPDP